MQKTYLILLFSITLCSCSDVQPPKQVTDQIQYAKTHTGYADSAALHYALVNEITPDSAVVLHNEHKW